MRNAASRLLTLALLSGATGLLGLGHPAKVCAQTTFFCPPPLRLQNGSCVGSGGAPGAFSGATVASQALSELSETATQATTRNTIDAVTKRRAEEEQRCAEGFSRVDGTCQRIPPPVAEAAPVVPPGPPEEHALKKVKKPKAAAVSRKEAIAPAPKIISRAPPPPPVFVPVPVEPVIRYATWNQVYGDYEKRDATGSSFLNCCFAPTSTIDRSLILNAQSREGTVGFLAGADATSRGLVVANDGLIVGVMAGYRSSDVTLNVLTLSRNPGNRGGGSSHLHANLSGPSAGLYGTYFNGPFSADGTVRLDAQTLDQRVDDFIVTTATTNNTVFVQSNG
jgi:Autotransporter beta-domain